MKTVTFDSSEDRFIISIDKKSITKETLLQLLENIRIETLAETVDFDDSIEDLGEEIKQEWWKKNKDNFIQSNIE